jgi:hypothetical protein
MHDVQYHIYGVAKAARVCDVLVIAIDPPLAVGTYGDTSEKRFR